MEFVELKENEFNKFSKNYKNKCYLQSSAVGELRKRNGWNVNYLGIKNNNKIIAATMLLSKKRKLKKEFYAMRGPLVDFNDTNVLEFFINNLKKYVKDNNGYILRIDPYVECLSRDKDANITNEFDNSSIKNNLKKLGFKEVNAKDLTDTVQAKFMYVIDNCNDINQIMKDMDTKTRQMIRKNEKNGIIIRKGSIEDIPLFVDIMNHTSERRHFNDRGKKFYHDMYECLSKENMISLMFAELDIDIAKQNIEKEKKEIDKARADREEKRKNGNCNEKKALAKEKEENEILNRLNKKEKELNEMQKMHGKKITLGGILYILYENEVASLFGGSYDTFKEYQCFYSIHYEMIKYTCENNYTRYNFYAINNTLDSKDSQYGIYQFKKSFGGHVVEYLGEFILPIDKFLYTINSIKKYINKKRNH